MSTSLVCKQCGFENEGERIYCHSCGAKLDRSVLPAKKTEESAEKTRSRVHKMTSPTRGFFAGWQKLLLSTVLWALLTAAVIQAIRPPDGVPPMLKKEDLISAPPVGLKLEDAIRERAPQQVVISADVINSFLQNAVKSSSDGLIGDSIKFDRAFVNLRDGACRITQQQSAFDYRFFAGVDNALSIVNNKVVATPVGGNIGRLPLHPLIMQFSDLLFNKLWDALSREHKLVDQMQSIRVEHDKITLTTKGAPAPR